MAEPPHSPAQSSTAEPLHSPAQSSTAEPLHSPAQSSTASPPTSPAQSVSVAIQAPEDRSKNPSASIANTISEIQTSELSNEPVNEVNNPLPGGMTEPSAE